MSVTDQKSGGVDNLSLSTGNASSYLSGKPMKKLEVSTADPTSQANLQKALFTLVGRDKFSDLEIVVGSGNDMMTINAHRLVLASASLVFAKMLYRDDSKASDTNNGPVYNHLNKQKLAIPDIRPSVFHSILTCLYSDRIFVDATHLNELLAASQKYELEVVREACMTFMAEGVTASNACALYQSNAGGSDGDFALSFICQNAARVFESEGFEQLSEDKLLRLLGLEQLMISEAELFKAVLRWGSRQLIDSKQDITPVNVARVLINVLPKIRFHTMSAQEIATIVAPSRLLPPSQLLELFSFIAQSSVSSSPGSSCSATPSPLFLRPQRLGGMPLNWGFSRRFSSQAIDHRSSTDNSGCLDVVAVVGAGLSSWSSAHGSLPLRGIATWRIVLRSAEEVYCGIATNTRFPDYSVQSPGVYAFSTKKNSTINGVLANPNSGTSGSSSSGSGSGSSLPVDEEYDLCYHPIKEKLFYSAVKSKGKSVQSIRVPPGEYVAHVCFMGTATITIQPIPFSEYSAKNAI